MIRADLHMHSTFSDGVCTPELLVEKAVLAGVNLMAITDHDTFAGCDSLQGKELPVRVIPGVELSLHDMRGLHLLGYGLTAAKELRETVAHLARQRIGRAQAMVDKLYALGMPLDWAQMTAACRGTVGRAHIARTMVDKGYAATVQDAFGRYLGEGKPAYVPGERLSMAETLDLMRRCGFVPVLAHPMQLNKDEMTMRILLKRWKEQGLMGVEVYHPSAMGKNHAGLSRMARSLGLIVTGGSDFHKEGDSHGLVGCTMDHWPGMQQDTQALLEALARAKEEAGETPAR